ncbi:DDHD domain-containing protein [Glomus cerebriforme]|uniref:DDHD domain-containing protein n=1 Tax=Glomus cerebriforme TaxID=658196 RepID=A0A397TMN9_9GLOM|nr:DDHD domain-containing protein [Glomus cerebriforme]
MNDEPEKAPQKVPKFICNSPDYPQLTIRWFHAVDVPVYDPAKTSPDDQDENNYPVEWIPFSKRDSKTLEKAFKSGQIEEEILVNEDFLFEVDIENREISPVYWFGPVYSVVRATWFYQNESNKIIPCNENLAIQIEQGYIERQAWEPPVEVIGPDGNIKVIPRPEKKWDLTDSQHVIYSSPTIAWLITDGITGKLSKSIFSAFTNGENLGGVRLIRGYEEVEKFISKKSSTDKSKDRHRDASLDRDQTPEARKRALERKLQLQEIEDYDNEESDEIREIDHLILVIHGVGQKLSERTGYTNFVHDVSILRKTLKNVYSTNPPPECKARLPPKFVIPKDSQLGNGVQVLPIHWRQEIKFGMASEDEDIQDLEGECSLDEITLDGVPGLRMMISDVLMDVLLYMTPKYRQLIIRTVTEEVNRVYNLFLKHNPKFKKKGKVSIYGHSLGSLIAFDVLCHQPPLFNLSNAVFGIFDEKKVADNDKGEEKNHEDIIKLDFSVWNFFAVGSPIGLFLMLKGLKIGSRKYLVDTENDEKTNGANNIKSKTVAYCYPAAKNIYNIFHRADPIAYRIEPLVSRRHATSLKPALIPYHKGGLKGVTIGITNIFSTVKTSLSFTRRKNPATSSSNSSSATNSRSGSMDISRKSFDSSTSSTKRQLHMINTQQNSSGISIVNSPINMSSVSFDELHGADKLKSLNSTGRIDYCLQEGILDINYIAAIFVHLNYWSDIDAAYFMLKEVYGNIYDEEVNS